ncbi:DNA mismatch repair protein MSH6 isoform X2 [Aristolochia californica]|uniref:DNA mismatch repair protein MSH6 isoform X2 n=1 Tax=Aristolochia californica TaxID=171875 RepID=UPI0035D65FFE
MAPSRRLINGRSPLVNKQSQITAFFSPGKDSTPQSSVSPVQSKKTPNPNNDPVPTRTPSPQLKQKKPLLVVGPSSNTSTQGSTPCLSAKKSYSDEVVGKRVNVFWPLDDAWYEGYVKSFDKDSGKHLVLYNDAEEEVLDLVKEKVEFLEDATKSFRRLRRASSVCEITTPEKTNSDEERGKEDWPLRQKTSDRAVRTVEKGTPDEDDDVDDDSMDEDWRDSVKETADADSEMEEEEMVPELERSNKAKRKGSRKRGMSGKEGLVAVKKSRVGAIAGKDSLNNTPVGSARRPTGPPSSADRDAAPCIFNNILTGDVAERYNLREMEKFGFLGVKKRDANGRQPGDANYDPRTLYMPPEFLKSLTGGQRQWWEFKSKHMDKVLFFKMGKFYELFEMDAHIGAKELDLQYMKGEQPHCGFPEKNFAMNVEKLAKKGYRVLVVEQTETPEQLELRRREMGSKDKVVKREICAVITKGTLTDGEMVSMNPDAAYIISLTEDWQSLEMQENRTVIGVCVADVSTSRFIVGQFEDDSERHCLSSILSELRPVEIVKPANMLSPETERVLLRDTRNPLVNDLVPLVEFWDAEKTINEVRNIYKKFRDHVTEYADHEDRVLDDLGELPDVLWKLIKDGNNGKQALAAFGGCLFYVRQAFLDETLLRFGKFEPLPCTESGFFNAIKKTHMILDSAALDNLEIFENSKNGGVSGTLYAQMDHCVTAFGKRLLKSWLARPLYHVESIVERQDAIAGLKGLSSAIEFRKELSRLPDMERLLARLFSSCGANGRNANKVVLYEDAAKKQLKEFVLVLRGCQTMMQACTSLGSMLDTVESTLLHELLTPGRGLPNIFSVLKHFEDAFDWTEADQSGRIVPHKGVDLEYDSALSSISEIEFFLKKHLEEQKKVLKDKSIKYVTVGKESFLLEVPESLQGNVPRDYELRSSKKGFFRYWTPKIKELLAELSQAEAAKEFKLKTILQRLIGQFCEHHIKWRQLVCTTAELDVLISLSIASDYYEGPTCRPTIRGPSFLSENAPSFSAKGLGHPVLRSDALGQGSFVPNDVTIGGEGHASFILLTGPNMGGKSTLLRQICLAAILAQVGADVPAESFELFPVDRIFVRMGAKDHIMSGQSTFLTELSETAAMLQPEVRWWHSMNLDGAHQLRMDKL